MQTTRAYRAERALRTNLRAELAARYPDHTREVRERWLEQTLDPWTGAKETPVERVRRERRARKDKPDLPAPGKMKARGVPETDGSL